MQIFDRYFFKEFLKNFIGAEILLIGVAVIAKFMENIASITSYQGPSRNIFYFIIYNIPNFVTIVTAPSLMFAVSFSVANFTKNNEVAVVLAAGRSFQRILLPVAVFTLFLSMVMLIFNEALTFPYNHKAYNLKHLIDGKGAIPRMKYKQEVRTNFEARANNRYFYFGSLDPWQGTFNNLHMIEFSSKGRVQAMVSADKGKIIPGRWQIQKASIIMFDSLGQYRKQVEVKKETLKVAEDKKYFWNMPKSLDETNIFDLWQYIQVKSLRGESIVEYEVELYWHFSFPLVCFFVVLIGGIVGSQVQKGAMASSIAISTGCTIGYFIIMYFGKSLGNNGTLPPLIAGWLANIVFFFISMFMLIRYHK